MICPISEKFWSTSFTYSGYLLLPFENIIFLPRGLLSVKNGNHEQETLFSILSSALYIGG
jgi:hypothetical protein